MEEELKRVIEGFNKRSQVELVTENFIIKDNLLKFQNVTVQISNISQIFAGKNKLKFSMSHIILGIISVIAFFSVEFPFIKVVGFIGIVITFFIGYVVYKKYLASKFLLKFFMNSGNSYIVPFSDEIFLTDVRDVVETSILKGDVDFAVNVGDRIIMSGNNQVITGDNNNLNTGIQKDVQVHSNNEIDQSSFSMDIHDSQIQGSNFGSNNELNSVGADFDWTMLESEFKKVLGQLKIESTLKEASEEALVIIKEKNESKFKGFIQTYSSVFTSDFFKNTASGLLVQWISKTCGIG
ncbi:hypothetical protein [uncultured Vagococcus sp.]|uniref:hypothetical protein n=1 Tax=uncultured Vagococcus sp. TaxID=189676 RepID=UPI0028D34081|nr:hypothetical protein [uncultured Vagococcus sp.]